MSGFSREGDAFALPPPLTSLLTLLDFSIIDVVRAEARVLNVPLKAPFAIASSRLESLGNVAIRLVLVDGSAGWGEAPILPAVTAEDQPTALARASQACTMLATSPAMSCRQALENVSTLLPGHDSASVRAGVEMAILDALAHSVGMPLWWLFGGQGNSVVTDITIPVCSSREAGLLALEYKVRGFQTIKTKVGGRDLKDDIDVLKAIRRNHPSCSLILDANGGYKASDALEVLRQLHELELTPILYEQPVAREDWKGLHQVATEAFDRYGVLVAADESCRSMEDVTRIVKGKLAHVVNIKLCKMGILVALEVVSFAQQAGLELMIGGMVETRIGMGFAAHMAAGLDSFSGWPNLQVGQYTRPWRKRPLATRLNPYVEQILFLNHFLTHFSSAGTERIAAAGTSDWLFAMVFIKIPQELHVDCHQLITKDAMTPKGQILSF